MTTAISTQALHLAMHRPFNFKGKRYGTIGRLTVIEFDLLDALNCIGQHASSDMVAKHMRIRQAAAEGRLQRARKCGLIRTITYGGNKMRPLKAYVPTDMGEYLLTEALCKLDESIENEHRAVTA